MRIPSFHVADRRNIRLATCDQAPQIMILTGPNGCGKSTLLDALRTAPGSDGRILYIGPHRISGRQRVRMRYLAGPRLLMQDLQSNQDLPNYEGITIHTRTRSAWDSDETNSYLKYALCQIELDRQTALTDRYDATGLVTRDSMPDVWTPLRDMTQNLLPHLEFAKIDVSDRDRIQCLWKVHEPNIHVDIDDLSSGEKAIINLFFPLIENRIQTLIAKCKSQSDDAAHTRGHPSSTDICVLMDEPELHLHPNLQAKVLDYLRKVTIRDAVQFILATHAPTIVEQATSEELFLLRPSQMVSPEENQLIRIASDEQRLALMREVFGSTSNITAMRPILVVEGHRATAGSTRPADERILTFLSDRFAQVTVMPGGSKAECKVLAQSLSDILSDEVTRRLKAYALVDRDLESCVPHNPLMQYLPVSMIENFLVDPEVIWKAIVTVRHKTDLGNEEDVARALDVILDGLTGHETDRRIKSAVGFHSFRLHDPVDAVNDQVTKHTQLLKERTSPDVIDKLKSEAHGELQHLEEAKKRRENYDGKKILEELYRRHLTKTGMSKEIFVYECARNAAKRKLVKRFVEDLFQTIENMDQQFT